MKKEITAIGNVFLNEELNKKENYEVLLKDIQYQEGVIETLLEYKEIDLILISTDLLGDNNIKEFINSIFNIKEKIEIVIFSNRIQNLDIKYLNSRQIYKIYQNDENGYNKFLENLYIDEKNSTQKIAQDLNLLKNMIISKEDGIIENVNIKQNYKTKEKYLKQKIIIVSGNAGAGKSVFSCILAQYLESLAHNILLIDYNLEEKSLSTILGVKNEKNNKKKSKSKKIDLLEITNNESFKFEYEEGIIFKKIISNQKSYYDFIIIDTSTQTNLENLFLNNMDIIYILEPNLLEIKKAKLYLEKIIEDWRIPSEKIKILFNKVNKYQIDDCILKNIFEKFEILGKLNYKEEYDLYINKCSKYPIKKQEFENIYFKLIKD